MKVITEANKKTLGREITFRDLVLFAIPKLTQRDLEKIQEQSLTDMEYYEIRASLIGAALS